MVEAYTFRTFRGNKYYPGVIEEVHEDYHISGVTYHVKWDDDGTVARYVEEENIRGPSKKEETRDETEVDQESDSSEK